MPSRSLPGLGLKGDWALGENNWKDEHDLNLLTLSVLVQARVLGMVAALPGAPTEGMVYLLDAAHATQPNSIAAYDEGAWRYFPPFDGLAVFDVGTAKRLEYKAGVWAETVAGGGGSSPITVAKIGAFVEFATGAGGAVIAASSNIASVVRTNTGRYRINFTTAFSNANYSVATIARFTDSDTSNVVPLVGIDRNIGFGKTAAHIDITVTTDAGAATDAASIVSITLFRNELMEVSGGASAYRYGGFAAGAILASEVLMDHVATDAHVLSDDFVGSAFSVGTAPAAAWVGSVRINGVEVGTLSVATTGVITAATAGAAANVAVGDVVSLIGPAVADETIARLRWTFKGAI